MFHPAANRLAGFLEISALSISLARSGGAQYKAGPLWIEASGNKGGGFGRKSTSWNDKRQSRWCAIRENYLVVLEEPGEVCLSFICRVNRTNTGANTDSLQSGTSSYWTRTSKLNGRSGTTDKA
jgi:hypothetical protein